MDNQKIISRVDYYPQISAVSEAQKDLLKVAKVLSESNPKILIFGEKGCGKETLATYIHNLSENTNYFRINCFLLNKKGKFNLDSLKFEPNTTVLWKNINLLDEGQLQTVFNYVSKLDVSIKNIFTSSTSVESPFLGLVTVNVLPLRHRKEDILPLASLFLNDACVKYNKNCTGFSENCIEALNENQWKGNCSELKLAVENACLLSENPVIQKEDLVSSGNNGGVYTESKNSDTINTDDKTLKSAINAFKRSFVIKILEENDWNQTKAAKVMDIQRTYLSRLLNELNIREK